MDRRPLEVDIVARSRDGRALLVGEAKLRLARADIDRARAELHAKAERLPFAAGFGKVVEVIFAADVPGGTRPGTSSPAPESLRRCHDDTGAGPSRPRIREGIARFGIRPPVSNPQ